MADNKMDKLQKKVAITKLLAGLLILGLATVDGITIWDMFLGAGAGDAAGPAAAIVCVVLLEGLPTLMGTQASLMVDSTKYKRNEKINSLIGFTVSLIGSVLVFYVIIKMRLLNIEYLGGKTAFMNQTYNAESGMENNSSLSYLYHFFVTFSPVATSILAFVISWTYFKFESLSELQIKLESIRSKYLAKQMEFMTLRDEQKTARINLWDELINLNYKAEELRYDVYREKIYEGIRNKIIKNCLDVYPSKVLQYNKEIEGLLDGYLSELANKSIDVTSVKSLTLDDIIRKHDKKCVSSFINQRRSEEMNKELKIIRQQYIRDVELSDMNDFDKNNVVELLEKNSLTTDIIEKNNEYELIAPGLNEKNREIFSRITQVYEKRLEQIEKIYNYELLNKDDVSKSVVEAWDYSICIGEQERELSTLLSNAFVIAQIRSNYATNSFSSRD